MIMSSWNWKKKLALIVLVIFLLSGVLFTIAAVPYFKCKDWKPVTGRVIETSQYGDDSFVCLIGYRIYDDPDQTFYTYKEHNHCNKDSFVGQTFKTLYNPEDYSDSRCATQNNDERIVILITGSICAVCVFIAVVCIF